MLYAVGEKVDSLTLFNPRLGSYSSLELNVVAYSAAAVSAVELLQDLIATMTGFQTSA